MRETGREDKYQQQVPDLLRALVPSRYGVEVVSQDGELWFIVSDQLRNRFAQARWESDYLLMGDDLGPRIVFPIIYALKTQPSIKAV